MVKTASPEDPKKTRFTKEEAAIRLGKSVRTLDRWRKEGLIRWRQPRRGMHVLITLTEIERVERELSAEEAEEESKARQDPSRHQRPWEKGGAK